MRSVQTPTIMRVIASATVLIAFFCYQAIGIGEIRRSKQIQQQNKSEECPELNIRYAVDGECDKYIQCDNGIASEKICPDGLLFNENASVYTYPCQYPIDVNCTQRARTQTAQPTGDCPHQFGYYKIGDASECGKYLNCVNGRGYNMTCPSGLAFNPLTYQCDWPDLVEDCDAKAFLQYQCPPETKSDGLGPEEMKFHKSDDCQRFFLCNNGRPRMFLCGGGAAFDESLNRCEAAQNVTGCEHLAVKNETENELNKN